MALLSDLGIRPCLGSFVPIRFWKNRRGWRGGDYAHWRHVGWDMNETLARSGTERQAGSIPTYALIFQRLVQTVWRVQVERCYRLTRANGQHRRDGRRTPHGWLNNLTTMNGGFLSAVLVAVVELLPEMRCNKALLSPGAGIVTRPTRLATEAAMCKFSWAFDQCLNFLCRISEPLFELTENSSLGFTRLCLLMQLFFHCILDIFAVRINWELAHFAP